eukprot:14987518-Ditylum_brightwellii.AAC.1
MPLMLAAAEIIKDGVIAPYSITNQMTFAELGEQAPKQRITHDQSFCYSSSKALNKRIHKDLFPPLIYGYCLLRHILYIHALRMKYPKRQIVIGKYDVKSAYRRGSMWGKLCAMCMTMVQDLAKKLLWCNSWNPETLNSPHTEKIRSPTPKFLDNDIPFGQAKEADVIVPADSEGKVDGYIDGTIVVGLYDKNNWFKLSSCVPLSIHIATRPIHKDEPIHRPDFLEFNNLVAEGRLEEHKIILDWNLDTRRLLVSLPNDKYSDWSKDINHTISKRGVRGKELESTEGRLNRTACVIPLERHFLNRIKKEKALVLKLGHPITLKSDSVEDFKL